MAALGDASQAVDASQKPDPHAANTPSPYTLFNNVGLCFKKFHSAPIWLDFIMLSCSFPNSKLFKLLLQISWAKTDG